MIKFCSLYVLHKDPLSNTKLAVILGTFCRIMSMFPCWSCNLTLLLFHHLINFHLDSKIAYPKTLGHVRSIFQSWGFLFIFWRTDTQFIKQCRAGLSIYIAASLVLKIETEDCKYNEKCWTQVENFLFLLLVERAHFFPRILLRYMWYQINFIWRFPLLGCSVIVRKPNETMRLIVTISVGVVFGFLIGISFPTLSITKVQLHCS